MNTDEKAGLRSHFARIRDGILDDVHQRASRQTCEHITQFCLSRRIRRMALFWPYRSEIDLRPLIRNHPDWTFFFPRISSTHPPRLIWGPEPLETGLFGLQEPVHAQHFVPPVPLVLVPGLAFDDEGFRLGYGMGFYDALIEHLAPEVITLGVGFEIQRTRELPVSPADMPIQGLITEKGLTRFGPPDRASDH